MRCMKSAVLARQTKTRSVPKKIASRSALFLILLLASCAAAIYVIADSTRSNAIVVQAAARGKGLLNPRDGRLLKVEYAGDAAISEAMRAGTARRASSPRQRWRLILHRWIPELLSAPVFPPCRA